MARPGHTFRRDLQSCPHDRPRRRDELHPRALLEGDPRDYEHEHPVQTRGLEQALGELVLCSRCVGAWAAAGLATTQVLAPRFGRMLTWTLAGAAINDFLQAGFVALTGKANELER